MYGGGIVGPLNGADIIRIIAEHLPLIVRHSFAVICNVPRYQPRSYVNGNKQSVQWLVGQEDNCGAWGHSRKRNTRFASELFSPVRTMFSAYSPCSPFHSSFMLFVCIAGGKLVHIDGFTIVVGSIWFASVVRHVLRTQQQPLWVFESRTVRRGIRCKYKLYTTQQRESIRVTWRRKVRFSDRSCVDCQ